MGKSLFYFVKLERAELHAKVIGWVHAERVLAQTHEVERTLVECDEMHVAKAMRLVSAGRARRIARTPATLQLALDPATLGLGLVLATDAALLVGVGQPHEHAAILVQVFERLLTILALARTRTAERVHLGLGAIRTLALAVAFAVGPLLGLAAVLALARTLVLAVDETGRRAVRTLAYAMARQVHVVARYVHGLGQTVLDGLRDRVER